jgi:hypothetical protein
MEVNNGVYEVTKLISESKSREHVIKVLNWSTEATIIFSEDDNGNKTMIICCADERQSEPIEVTLNKTNIKYLYDEISKLIEVW